MAKRLKTRTVRFDEVIVDRAVNPRERISPEHVEDIREAIRAKKPVPHPVCYDVDGKLKLSEGFHRWDAYRLEKRLRVEVVVVVGTDDEWAAAALCSNQDHHALKRTNADKRRAVEGMLKRFPKWSNPKLAEAVGVSIEFVRQMRPQVATVATCDEREGRDGKTYTTPQADEKSTTSDEPKRQGTAPPPEPESVKPPPAPETSTPDPSTNQHQLCEHSESAPASDDESPPAGDAGEPPPEEEPAEHPADAYVATVNRVCVGIDRIKAEVEQLKADPWAGHTNVPSVCDMLAAARKALWQGRPTEPCAAGSGVNKSDRTSAARIQRKGGHR